MRLILDLATLIELSIKSHLKYCERELTSELYYFKSIGDDYEIMQWIAIKDHFFSHVTSLTYY